MTFLNRFAVWRAGGRSVKITSGTEVDLSRLDGLVIGGGDDISAHLYGGEVAIDVRVDPKRDALEMQALEMAEKKGLPVLGICRGSQIMNVFYGGSLHGEIRERYKDAPHMRTVLPRKCVDIRQGTQLAKLLAVECCFVNSLHHQAVDRLGDGFAEAAADAHGMVQAIEHSGRPFLIGVQWHPEFLFWQPRQQRIFKTLVEAAS